MARRTHLASEGFIDPESYADRLLDWISANLVALVILAVLLLIGVAGYAGWRTWRSSQEEVAAAALGAAEREYLTSMGAEPASYEFSEPANPETAKRNRAAAVDRLLAVAKQYEGRRAATMARIEAGSLLSEIQQPGRAIEVWGGALAGAAAHPDLRALVQERIAQAHESLGHWKEAAEAYAAAAEIPGYPLHAWTLANAARCYAAAGDADQAQTFANRVQAEAPNAELPPYLTARLQEIRAARPTPTP